MNRPPQKKRFFRSSGGGRSQRAGQGVQGNPAGPPEETFRESEYLKRLVEEETAIVVRLRNNEEFAGVIEYYDATFIRLTRKQAPNLFIYKHDIKYMSEDPDAVS